MGDIYSRAVKVYAWLGLSNQTRHDVMKLLSKFAADGNSHANSPEDDRTALREHGSCIRDFFDKNEYWSRVWLIREISKAKMITLICGPDTVGFSSLDTIFNSKWTDPSRRSEPVEYRHASHLWKTRAKIQDEIPIKFLRALWDARRTKLTHPADKVNSLQAITEDSNKFLETPSYFGPDDDPDDPNAA